MLDAQRVTESGQRQAVQLTNGLVRVVVDDMGGMVPELSFRGENGYFNTHWIPSFRSNAGVPYTPERHAEYWGGELLYEIAGNFPCFPSFGMPGRGYGVEFDAHGTTAHGLWRHEKAGAVERQAVYAVSSLQGRPPEELSYRKYDILLRNQPIHYSVLAVRNSGERPYRINAAWHNTVGAPFLAAGCLIDVCADRFATVPAPNEFENTGRFAMGREFDDLTKVPTRDGKSVDARQVPGMVGYTDLVAGSVPADASIGWSAVVNPYLAAVYLCFFKGPRSAGEDDVVLHFNDLWFQYGGRRFTPWALIAGGSDQIFCLGTENATGAYANGLEYSLAHPTLLGQPTTIEIPARSERTLYYATLAAQFEGGSLRAGVSRVEEARGKIVVSGKEGTAAQIYAADARFDSVAELVRKLG